MPNLGVIIFGALTGCLMERYTAVLIRKRTKGNVIQRFSGTKKHSLLWAAANSISWFLIFSLGGLNLYTVECLIIISVVMVLSAVDISIKKIPNELLVVILAVHILALLIDGKFSNISLSVYGFIFGFIIFLLPSFIGKGAGLGDVKFAAVSGFFLGTSGLLVSVLIMTFFLAVYAAYLTLNRKGGLKTKLALGPFMASGVAAVMIFNIVNGQNILNLISNYRYL